MSNSRITPFVKRMRVNGGTIFSFSSAVEDIGLNINEKNNIVKISNFALLDIPSIDEPDDLTQNYFNIRAINGAWEYEQDSASIKDGRVLISESFQNYALNLETFLLDQDTYNPTLLTTVSERVFWKWMKETGATRWIPDVSNYWTEELDVDGSAGYNAVIKYIGQVSAGNVRQDSFGTYNETYILVPTSHGETRAYFKQIDDENYHHGISFGDGPEKILGREDFLQPHPDGLSYNAYYDFVDSSTQTGAYTLGYDPSLGIGAPGLPGWWWSAYNIDPGATYADNVYLVDPSVYIDTGIYHTDLYYTGGTNDFFFRRSNVDCVSLEFDLDNLKSIYGDSTLTYDKMATEFNTNDTFEFNTVLIYYTVYNSTGDVKLATNLLGVMFLDAPSGNSSNIGVDGILLPSLEKIMSTGTGFGTSYSLRLNIKTDNMIDDTGALVVDFATSDQLYGEDFTGIFYELEKAVNILNQNNSTTNFISTQYTKISSVQSQQQNQIIDLKNQINDINRDIVGPENTITMFAGINAEDPLIESSIYMKFGSVGIGETDPKWKLHVDGSAKVNDLVIENAIRDTSDNIILGYGSPLQLGSSTNYRDISFYTGGGVPAAYIDSSQNINFAGDVSIKGAMYVESSLYIAGTYVDPEGGADSLWKQFGGDIYYDIGQVGIGKLPAFDLDVSGNINFDGSIYQNGILFSGGAGATAFIALTDTPAGYGSAGQILQTNGTNALTYIDTSTLSVSKWLNDKTITINLSGSITGDGSALINGDLSNPTINITTTGGGGSTTFIGLSDTPAGYGTSGQILQTNGASLGYLNQIDLSVGYAANSNSANSATSSTTSTKWLTARNFDIALTGDVSGNHTLSVDGTSNRSWSIGTTVNQANVNYWSLNTGKLNFNGKVGINNIDPSATLDVSGNIHSVGDISATGEIEGFASSDERLKTDILSLDQSKIEKLVLSLDPIRYKHIVKDKVEIGLIAQEVEKYFPEIVKEDHKGFKMIEYSRLVVPLISIIKEQDKKISRINERLLNIEKGLNKN